MQKFLNTLWEFTVGKEDKNNFIQKALKVCKVFKVKPSKTPRPDVPSKNTAYNLFFRNIEKIKKKSCRVFLSIRQVQSYRRNGKNLRLGRRRRKGTGTFTKKRNDDMERPCRDIKKVIWMKWKLLTFKKGVTRRLKTA